METEHWRFVHTPSLSPEMNMAVDEAILTMHSRGEVPPTIRFYSWDPATLSIGYFQKIEKEVHMESVRRHGFGFVRRPTGGRAVLHDQELTYSVIVSENHPRMPNSVTESYRVLSTGLMHGFRRLGFHAEMVSLATEEEKKKYTSAGSAACFDSPSWYELVVEGRKVAGSAQTRQKGTILQHGSILLDLDVEALFDVLVFKSERLKQRLKSGFSEKAVAMNQLREKPVTMQEAVAAFYDGMASGLEVELTPEALTAEEQALAEQLAENRYGSDTWNFKR